MAEDKEAQLDDVLTPRTRAAREGGDEKPVAVAAIGGYGVVSMGLFAADLFINIFYLQFLLDYAKINASLAGFILSAGEGAELVASFLVGIASDKTRSVLGRRRPWILAGMFLLPGAILACFSIPPFNESGRIAFYFCAIIVYNFLFSVTSIPHQALSPELSGNYDTRMKLSTSRSSFSFAGMLLVVTYAFLVVNFLFPTNTEVMLAPSATPDAPAQLVPTVPIALGPVENLNETNPYAVPIEYAHLVIAAFPAGAVLIGGAITVGLLELVIPRKSVAEQQKELAGEEEDDRISTAKSGNFCVKMCRIFGILAFDLVVAMFSLCSTAIAITGSLLPLFIVTTIGFPFETFTLVTIVLTGTMVLTIIVLSRIAYRFEKKTLFNFGAILCILCSVGFYFVPGVDDTDPVSIRYLVYIMAGFVGIGHALTFTVPGSMMADVTDMALVRLEERHEGLMFSLMETIQSLLQASTMWVLGLVLDQVGYDSSGTGLQTELVRRVIRYLFCFIPLGVFFIAWLLSFAYPITREKHKDILTQIRILTSKRRQQDLGALPSSRYLPVKALIATTMVRENFNDADAAEVHALVAKGRAETVEASSTPEPPRAPIDIKESGKQVQPDVSSSSSSEEKPSVEKLTSQSKKSPKAAKEPPKSEEKQVSKSKLPSLKREITTMSDVTPEDNPASPKEAEKAPALQTDSDQSDG